MGYRVLKKKHLLNNCCFIPNYQKYSSNLVGLNFKQ